ncbi:MAG: cytochrome P450 [Candidatus Limnocylindrales bacterium]
MKEPGPLRARAPEAATGPAPGMLTLGLLRNAYRGLPRLAEARGDVATARLGPHRLVLVSHPTAVREVLVSGHETFTKGDAMQGLRVLLGDGLITSDGPWHAHRRRAIQGLFGQAHDAAWAPAIVEAALSREATWRDGEVREMQAEMLTLSLDATTRTLFHEALAPADLARLQRAAATVSELSSLTSLPWPAFWVRTPLTPFRRFREARDVLRGWAEDILERRRRTSEAPDDVLGAILRNAPPAGPDRAARDEVITFLMAAHVTTGHALAWALHLVAGHQTSGERLAREADAALKATAGRAQEARLLPFSRAVFAETLRLYPPAWAIGRQATRRASIDRVEVDPADLVLLSPWVTQRDGRWFERPAEFEPERWMGQGEAVRFSYFPFGLGSRRCVGEPLAWLEGSLVLATLASHWAFERVDGDPPQLRAGITLAARGGLPLRIRRRLA